MRPRRRSMTPSAYRSASAAAPVGAGVIGLGGRPAILAIEPLIEIVREVDHAVADGERAAAILVSARANAESVGVVGRHAFRLPVRADAVDESSSLLLRLSFAPIDCVAVERDLLETDRVADDEVGGYGRRPKAIGAGGHASRPVLASAHELHRPARRKPIDSRPRARPISDRTPHDFVVGDQPCIADRPGILGSGSIPPPEGSGHRKWRTSACESRGHDRCALIRHLATPLAAGKDVPIFALIDSAVCCTSLAHPSDRGPEGARRLRAAT